VVVIISPRTARRYLRDIHEPHLQFRTRDGQVLSNLIDLACYLKACEADSFNHHVTKEHNHFSNWVENVITDRDLARQMSVVLDRNPMRIIVIKRVNILVFHAARTPSGRERARMVLESAQLPEEHFVSTDGRMIRNLWELEELLQTSRGSELSYHVSPSRNDFAQWVGEVLLDFELADRMMRISDSAEMAREVEKRISELEAFGSHKPRGQTLGSFIQRARGEPLTV
jgi:hypothetical protein